MREDAGGQSEWGCEQPGRGFGRLFRRLVIHEINDTPNYGAKSHYTEKVESVREYQPHLESTKKYQGTLSLWKKFFTLYFVSLISPFPAQEIVRVQATESLLPYSCKSMHYHSSARWKESLPSKWQINELIECVNLTA